MQLKEPVNFCKFGALILFYQINRYLLSSPELGDFERNLSNTTQIQTCREQIDKNLPSTSRTTQMATLSDLN